MRGRLTAATIGAVTWILSRLPLSVAQRIGALLADLVWLANLRAAQVTRTNIDVCFGERGRDERTRLAHASLRETGKLVAESGVAWRASASRWHRAIARVVGEELLKQARDAGTGVLILVPHFGNWELLNLYLGERYGLVAMYVPTRHAALDARIAEWRNRTGSRLVSASRSGIRALYRSLRSGGVVAILPDQVPPRSAGVYAPFFGRQALTITLPGSMLRSTGARALLGCAARCEGGRFELRFETADAGCAHESPIDAATALNRSIESLVRRDPAQYQWEYKRFRNPPAGSQRIY